MSSFFCRGRPYRRNTSFILQLSCTTALRPNAPHALKTTLKAAKTTARHVVGPRQTAAVHFVLIKVVAHPHPFTREPQSNSRSWQATSVAARQLAVLPCLLFMVRCRGVGGGEKKNKTVFIKMGCRRWCAVDLLVIRFQLFVCF